MEPTAEASVVELEKVDIKGALMISGFIGSGLAASIALDYLISNLKMHQVAFVRSRLVPPVAVFIGGKLRHPFRIYVDKVRKRCCTICEVALTGNALYPIAAAIIDWAEKKGIREIVVLEGMPTEELPEGRDLYCAAELGRCKAFEAKGIRVAERGYIGGMAGAILSECLTRDITGVAFITPAVAFLPDPGGAAKLLDGLNTAYGLGVDTTELLAKAEEIKARLREVAEHYQKTKDIEKMKGMPEGLYV